eukprot:NODE_20830_length_780_cov_5.473201.p1 GENE.NODE_20830_length_780_cov_5.473201~~NODE_20830_length_780_cov_5.473201.p1  ORF type:complete len:82 (-),score=1.57 NODE_20830_length_780_cov_5.473201:222-467(-)
MVEPPAPTTAVQLENVLHHHSSGESDLHHARSKQRRRRGCHSSLPSSPRHLFSSSAAHNTGAAAERQVNSLAPLNTTGDQE